jgi:integrase
MERDPHDLRRTGETIAQAARLPVDFVKALLNHNDKGVTGVYARWHMFEEKREAVMVIELQGRTASPESRVTTLWLHLPGSEPNSLGR